MNPYLDAIIGPSWLDVGHDATISYAFGSDYGYPWLAAELAAFQSVFRSLEAVCGITFVEAPRGEAEIVEHKVDFDQARILRNVDPVVFWHGWQDWPSDPIEGERSGFYDHTKDYWASTLFPGGTAYWLILHEIGHGLGLEHPHSAWHGTGVFPGVTADNPQDAGDYDLNGQHTTMMSYRGVVGQPGTAAAAAATPMAFDIAALQAMYGANMATGAGDNVYQLYGGAWRCIWDAGGTDTLNGTGGNDVLDLRAATLLTGYGGGGFFSWRTTGNSTGGLSIANGVVIENATGGGGADTLIGNEAANVLTGAALNDTLNGLGGADILNGGGGADTFFFGNDTSADRAIAGAGDILKQFDSGEDKIDLTAHNAVRVWVTADGANWDVNVSLDANWTAERSLTVIGVKPLLSDILW